MACFTVTWKVLLLGYILVWDPKIAWADEVQVQAFTGDNITLNCSSGETVNTDSTGVYWNRTDLQQDTYVLFYRDNRSDPDYQDPRYKDRVQLADPDFKDNNISIIIKNVSVNDSGTYECKLIQGGASDGNIFNKPPIRTFKLIITEKEKMDKGPEKNNLVAAGLAVVFLVVAFLVVAFLVVAVPAVAFLAVRAVVVRAVVVGAV